MLDEFLIIIYPQMLEVHSAFPWTILFLANLMESSLKFAQHDDASGIAIAVPCILK